ncbi:MAG: 3-deoxy-manno-octulosonate cytidylyltransferase [Planctomycetia bacterium]|nr:3-deoxy-manno-octulosonate cytidylyltransferase [Planctomycetia bacterium]
MAQPAPKTEPRLSSLVIIPARLHSTRLPRKLLLAETGKSVIQHTYEGAKKATRPMDVCVAADHSEIVSAVRSFGGQVQMTRPDHPSGTDRVAEAAVRMPPVDVIVNVQGDEPEISGQAIDLAVELLEQNPAAAMSTLATPIRSLTQLHDPSCVKVVFDECGRALYFSRSVIPHPRVWRDDLLSADPPVFFQHVGLYAYRRVFLLEFSRLPATRLEEIEKLEQLRVLSAGHEIVVGVIDEPTIGIDTADDYRGFVARMCGQHFS